MTLRLADFDVSADRGFLCKYEADEHPLPGKLAAIDDAGENLPDWLSTGKGRTFMAKMPEVDVTDFVKTADEATRRWAMVRYSFLAQAWVWGEPEANAHLPRNIAVPYVHIADSLGQFPLLPYSGYVLDNWARIDKNGPIVLENIRMLQNFLNGQDENWFVMIHVEIEAHAGRALAAIPALLDALTAKDESGVAHGLTEIRKAWEKINPTMDRMIERCDPYIYYNRVRPYIHGWQDNPALPQGVFYEGVEKFGGKGQAFRGQTGSQSSIVPTMDALFNISHENDPLRQFLQELHAYRPVKHRKFIDEVAKRSTLRQFVIDSGSTDLRNLYNACIEHVRNFRTKHLEYAASYINKQSGGGKGNDNEVGTGGTPFMKYLKKHRDESASHLI